LVPDPVVALCQPRLGIDRAAVAAQLEIYLAARARLCGIRHDTHRLAGLDPLADRAVGPP
jgi:hypothetical protein